jgi:hypothetical protein
LSFSLLKIQSIISKAGKALVWASFFLGAGQHIIAKSNKHVGGFGACCNVPLTSPTIMRDISSATAFFSIAAGVSLIIGASIINTPAPAKDALAYSKCIQIHPQRYCAITFLGAN